MTARLVILGFTGSRHGLTPPQTAVLRAMLQAGKEFHHGDCIGADAAAAAIAHELGLVVVAHPPAEDGLRAFFPHSAAIQPARPYLARNRQIVAACDRLLACPRAAQEERRSGTWYTVRFAERMRKPVVVVLPDGGVQVRS